MPEITGEVPLGETRREYIQNGVAMVEVITRRNRAIFTCPMCEEEREYIGVQAKCIAWKTGDIGVATMIEVRSEGHAITSELLERYINYDDDPEDWNVIENNYECSACHEQINKEEINANISYKIQEIRTVMPASNIHDFRVIEGKNKLLYDTVHQITEENDTMSPIVISGYKSNDSGYGYALTEECPNCHNGFVVGQNDREHKCPTCNYEFTVKKEGDKEDTPRQQETYPHNRDARNREFGGIRHNGPEYNQ